MVEIVPARPDHIGPIASAMRPTDIAEVWAASLSRPTEALQASLDLSPMAWTAIDQGLPVAMWGVSAVSTLSKRGIPWMLGSNRLERIRREVLRHSPPHVGLMLEHFPILGNYVDARNHASIRWLTWLGFTIKPARPFGPFGLAFHPFELRRCTDVRQLLRSGPADS